MVLLFFFFQAEDGIRDYEVTGVQTCALPILPVVGAGDGQGVGGGCGLSHGGELSAMPFVQALPGALATLAPGPHARPLNSLFFP